MNSLRRWLYRPKRSDPSLLAQFYFADEELNLIAAELDGFEGRKDPERCAALVNQLRACQARVLNIVSQMMDESIKDQRALRDFRVKFPDDVIQENLAGQLWFGAECLAAGSSIMNREVESACMRPLARALTKNLDSLRTILREQCLRNVDDYTDVIKENLIIFDKLFAEFELSYVSAMVSVKTAHEYDMIQEITVLFSETVQRALKIGLLTQEMIDEYDPALMFTIPRLAIISGVLVFKDGPLNPDNDPWNISEMFRPFQTLLLKIRELLGILTSEELGTLERALCSQDEPSFLLSLEEKRKQSREERRRHKRERKSSNGKVKNNRKTSDGDNGSIESELTAKEIAERLEALALSFEATHNHNMNNNNSGDSVDDSNSLSTDTLVNGGNPKSEELPSVSVQNNIADVPVGDSTYRQSLAIGLSHVEDLYREANLDSSDMITSSSSSAYPGNNLLVQGIQMPTELVSHGENTSQGDDSRSLSSYTNLNLDNNDHQRFLSPNETSEEHDEVLNDRDKFSLNKCDSKDSGLQSEVVSNSGSMFTISSSDSNQQILSSDSIPTPSDQNSADSSEDVDPPETSSERNGTFNRQLENSSDSSATITSSMANKGGKDNYLNPGSTTNEEFVIENQTFVNSTASPSHDESTHSLHPDVLEKDDTDTPSGSCIDTKIESPELDVTDSTSVVPNSAKDSDSGSLSREVSSDSSESVISVSSNHSLNEVCDKSKNDAQSAVSNKNEWASEDLDSVFSDTNVQGEEDGGSSSIATNGMGVGLIQPDDSESLPCKGEEFDEVQPKDVDSSAHNIVSNEQPSLSHQLSTSSRLPTQSTSEARMILNVSSNNDDAVKVEESNHPSENGKETPHSSQTTPQVNVITNGSNTTPVKNTKNGHRKGASNGKVKANSRKKSKHGDRRAHQHQETGQYRPTLCPHHAKILLEAHHTLDAEHYNSSDTSSYTSECGDQEEIALAIEAAESATRNHVRARFRSSSDMIHRLFVCISGVADQLQTNFAGDLRNILRCVFDMNCPDPLDACENDKPKDTTPLGAAYRAMSHASRTPRHRHSSLRRDPPTWLPDDQSNDCMACQVPFNFLRRRHHCRNCGKIFCSRCSSNFVPLPHFGQEKAVRICNRCFMFQVTPFTTE